MRLRKTRWLDTNRNRPMYGIKAELDGHFFNLAKDGKPLLFQSEQARDVVLDRLRRKEKEAKRGR